MMNKRERHRNNFIALSERVIAFVQRERLDRVLLILIVLTLIGTMSMMIFEGEELLDGMWWSFVTLTTVGYGDITPASTGGRLIGLLLMFSGIGILATFSATIASVLVNQKIQADLGMSVQNRENHLIICEWNHTARSILRELRADSKTAEMPVVLIADIERKPIEDDNLYFIRGSATAESLARANLAKAATVVILGDDTLNITARDAKAVMSALAVESINTKVYTIVELSDKANIQYCKYANADEIIVGSELSGDLIAKSAVNHGLARVTSQILRTDDGCEFYQVKCPPSMVGRQFREVLVELNERYNAIPIAIQKQDHLTDIINPPASYIIEAGDSLLVIAEERPVLK